VTRTPELSRTLVATLIIALASALTLGAGSARAATGPAPGVGLQITEMSTCPRPLKRALLTVDPAGTVRLLTNPGPRGLDGRSATGWKRLSEADLLAMAETIRTAHFDTIPETERTPDPSRRQTPDTCTHTLDIQFDGKAARFRHGLLSKAPASVQRLVGGLHAILDRHD